MDNIKGDYDAAAMELASITACIPPKVVVYQFNVCAVLSPPASPSPEASPELATRVLPIYPPHIRDNLASGLNSLADKIEKTAKTIIRLTRQGAWIPVETHSQQLEDLVSKFGPACGSTLAGLAGSTTDHKKLFEIGKKKKGAIRRVRAALESLANDSVQLSLPQTSEFEHQVSTGNVKLKKMQAAVDLVSEEFLREVNAVDVLLGFASKQDLTTEEGMATRALVIARYDELSARWQVIDSKLKQRDSTEDLLPLFQGYTTNLESFLDLISTVLKDPSERLRYGHLYESNGSLKYLRLDVLDLKTKWTALCRNSSEVNSEIRRQLQLLDRPLGL